MRFRNFVVIGVALFAGLTVLQARSKKKGNEGWSRPFDQWSRSQVEEMLQDSPWAKSQEMTTIINTKNSGEVGEKDLFYKFTVRFFSALPVREGYVRMYEILNHYDSMEPAQKQQFDARFRRALGLDVSDRVIVALEFATNDPQVARSVMDFLHTATKDTFSQTAYLINQRLGRVYVEQYYPPSADGTGAKFIFPRVVNGQQVFLPEDKEIHVEIHIPTTVFSRAGLSATPNPDAVFDQGQPGSVSGRVSGADIGRMGVDQKIFLTFDAHKMLYDGNLSF